MEIKQNRIREVASTIVVINGLATTAGSKWHFFAKSGKEHPTVFAKTTVINNCISSS